MLIREKDLTVQFNNLRFRTAPVAKALATESAKDAAFPYFIAPMAARLCGRVTDMCHAIT